MKKIIVSIYAFLLALVLIGCGNDEKTNEKTIEEMLDEVEVSMNKNFTFSSDLEGWNYGVDSVDDNVSWTVDSKTSLPSIKLSGKDSSQDNDLPNTYIFNKFNLNKNDKYLVIDANILSDSATSVRLKALFLTANGYETQVLKMINNTKSPSENGYYEIDGYSSTKLVYDFTQFIGKEVSVVIEQDSLGTNENGLFINKIYFTTSYSGLSQLTSWTSNTVASDWELRGNVTINDKDVILSNRGNNSSIVNKVRISSKNPYLIMNMKYDNDSCPNILVYLNGKIIECYNPEGKADETGDNGGYKSYLYDFKNYRDQVVTIEIVNSVESNGYISSLEFVATKQGFSHLTSWDTEDIKDEWLFENNVEVHIEGICLETYSKKASMTNTVNISAEACYLNFCFRKFVRDTVQDKDPVIRVYANDVLVKPCHLDTDYVTVQTDEYEFFCYDFTEYIGQQVRISIVNESGEHACFKKIYFDSTKEIEKNIFNSEQYTIEYLNGVLINDNRNFDFSNGSYELLLDNCGAQYDKSLWISTGRNGKPCIVLDGSDLADSTNFVPNSWIISKFNLTTNDNYITLNLESSENRDSNLRVRVITIENEKINSTSLSPMNSDVFVDDYGYCLINDNSPKTLTFDISSFVGEVYISIEQDDDGEGGGELINIYSFEILNELMEESENEKN